MLIWKKVNGHRVVTNVTHVNKVAGTTMKDAILMLDVNPKDYEQWTSVLVHCVMPVVLHVVVLIQTIFIK